MLICTSRRPCNFRRCATKGSPTDIVQNKDTQLSLASCSRLSAVDVCWKVALGVMPRLWGHCCGDGEMLFQKPMGHNATVCNNKKVYQGNVSLEAALHSPLFLLRGCWMKGTEARGIDLHLARNYTDIALDIHCSEGSQMCGRIKCDVPSQISCEYIRVGIWARSIISAVHWVFLHSLVVAFVFENWPNGPSK